MVALLCAILALMLSAAAPGRAFAGTLWSEGDLWYGNTRTSIFHVDPYGTYAYCVEPDRATPAFTGYTEHALADHAVATLLYFAWGGPGFRIGQIMGVWPTTSWDGSAFDSGPEYYIASHILLSDSYVLDSTRSLYGAGGMAEWARNNLLGYFAGGNATQSKILALSALVPPEWYSKVFVLYTGAQDIVGRQNIDGVEPDLTVNPNGGAGYASDSNFDYFKSGTFTTATKLTKMSYGLSRFSTLQVRLSRTGYTPEGLYTAASGGTKVYDYSANPTGNGSAVNGAYWNGSGPGSAWKGRGGNTTVYAHWTPNSYSIAYNLAGGSHGSSHPTSAKYDTAFTVSNPTRTGYTFTGWNVTGMDSVTHAYGSRTTTATTLSQVKDASYKNLRSTAGTVTFTATWTPITYYVAFDGNGATGGATERLVCVYDRDYTMRQNGFTRPDWTFSSWNRASNGSGVSHAVGAKFKNLSATSGATITVYAQWNPNVRYVVDGRADFYSNEVKSGADHDIANNGKAFSVPRSRTSAATRSNCTHADGTPGFDGWYTDEACTRKWADGTAVSAPLTLYARNWETIRFENRVKKADSSELFDDVTCWLHDAPDAKDSLAKTSGELDQADPPDMEMRVEAEYGKQLDLGSVKYNPSNTRVEYSSGATFPSTLIARTGWYADEACADGPHSSSLKNSGNKTYYKKWVSSVTDGVDSSRK